MPPTVPRSRGALAARPPCAACSRRARCRVLGSAIGVLATRHERWVDARSRWSPRGRALHACGPMAHGPGWRGRPAGTGGPDLPQTDRRSTITADPPSWLEGQHALIAEKTPEAALAFRRTRCSTVIPGGYITRGESWPQHPAQHATAAPGAKPLAGYAYRRSTVLTISGGASPGMVLGWLNRSSNSSVPAGGEGTKVRWWMRTMPKLGWVLVRLT